MAADTRVNAGELNEPDSTSQSRHLGLRHSRRHRWTRWVIAAAVAVGVVGAATGAYAYWSANGGGGSGTASVATPANLTISPATPSASLYPGGSTTVVATISNPNPTAAHIPSLVLDTSQGSGGFAVDSSHTGCTTALAALTFTDQSAGWDVPAKVGSTNGSLSPTLSATALRMGTGAASACQGAVFTVYLKVGS